MKKLKLIVLLCAVLLFVVAATACGGSGETSVQTEDGTTTSETPAEVTTEAPPPTSFASMSIGETPISEYKIVYARSEYFQQARVNRKLFPVYDFDYETANRLATLIYEKTGIELSVVEDKKATVQSDYEILIGKTDRTESSSLELTSDDYTINVSGNKLVICGGEYGTTWHAIDYLEEMFGAALEARATEFAFDADYSYDGNYHLTRIGCIGDSITEGVGSSNGSLYSYPAQLGRYLWKDALVYNYGSSGATMRSGHTDAYTKRDAYNRALAAAEEMDLYTIMLGTNDSNRDRTWSTALSEDFNNSCLAIVESLRAKNADLEFVLANCPAYFGADGFGSAAIRNLQSKLVTTLNDAGYPTSFFDMYSVTKTLSEYFPDNLHPNDQGHMLIAEAFAEALEALITGEDSAD